MNEMDRNALASLYREYIHCLNQQDWERLPNLLHQDVTYNGRLVGVAGYRAMLCKKLGQYWGEGFNNI